MQMHLTADRFDHIYTSLPLKIQRAVDEVRAEGSGSVLF